MSEHYVQTKTGSNSSVPLSGQPMFAPGDSEFNRLLTECGVMSTDGLAFVKQSVDPFHDYNIRRVGVPDKHSGDSLIRHSKSLVSISKPAGLAAGGTWDAHIVLFPFANAHLDGQFNHGTYNLAVGELSATTDADFISGPLVINSVTSGTDTFTKIANTASSQFTSLDIINSIGSGGSSAQTANNRYRVVSAGLELIDRTAELYKQGSLLAYRQSTNWTDAAPIVLNSAGVSQGVQPCRFLQGPPSSTTDVEQMAAVRFEAKDGAYMPIHVKQDKGPQLRQPCAMAVSLDSSAGNVITQRYVGRDSTTDKFTSLLFFDHDLQGIYLKGLGDNSVFDLFLHEVIEQFPLPSDQGVQSLVHPSPRLDEKALQCVPHIFAELPLCVPANENSVGDFWKRVVSAVKRISGPLMSLADTMAPALSMIPLTRPVAVGYQAARNAQQAANLAFNVGKRLSRKRKRARPSSVTKARL